MQATDALPLVVGLSGTELGKDERSFLEQVRPVGVILFARNLKTLEQVRQLVADLRDLQPPPFVCIDLEGGAVNRLAGFWGNLPSPARAAAAGRRAVQALGEAAGSACRCLGVHLDLAPVVDLERPEGLVARQSRCLSDDPERVATLAEVFNAGLEAWCVSGCIKHFPGLGAVAVDTHDELPVLELDEAELRPHLEVFARLSESIPVVMMGHVIVPALSDNKQRPASLNRDLVARAGALPGSPAVLSDDMEMGAVAGLGDLPELVVAALHARNHGVTISKSFDRLPEIADRIRQEAEQDPSFATHLGQLTARLGTLSRDLCRKSGSIPAPEETTVRQLWERARREAEP
jgi:beta-N-acetylhexosaminidase